MTTSELAEVQALLLKVLPDPMGFAQRVLGELAERLVSDPTGAIPNAASAEELSAHQALADREVQLAAALGACECWGEQADCPDCRGHGSPGWVPPDPELYAELVAPAARRSSPDEASPMKDKEQSDD